MSQCLTCNSQIAGIVDKFTFLDSSGNSNLVTQPPTHPPTPTNMSAQPGSAHHDPMDHETPVSNSHKAEATTFTEAISKVLKTNKSSKPKLWEPDLMVPTLKNSAPSSYSANSTSEIVKIFLRTKLIKLIISSPI